MLDLSLTLRLNPQYLNGNSENIERLPRRYFLLELVVAFLHRLLQKSGFGFGFFCRFCGGCLGFEGGHGFGFCGGWGGEGAGVGGRGGESFCGFVAANWLLPWVWVGVGVLVAAMGAVGVGGLVSAMDKH
uniref:Transmembrane protein n=1 Tax=Fagus sylvatica TaxID=28930 RepID=A0A2N9IHY3_FAGSY